MSLTQRFLALLRSFFFGTSRPRGGPARGTDKGLDKGRTGSDATREVDPHRIGRIKMKYSPVNNGDPDPGEIVWTWVPFEEGDGRGKDRPVLVVATESGGTLLAVQLTSKEHKGRPGYVALGIGPWDSAARPSWADTGRVFRVHTGGMRREAATVDSARFTRVAAALSTRYGWA